VEWHRGRNSTVAAAWSGTNVFALKAGSAPFCKSLIHRRIPSLLQRPAHPAHKRRQGPDFVAFTQHIPENGKTGL
jgi:hypothetical protein